MTGICCCLTPGPTVVPFSALGVVAGATIILRLGNWVLAIGVFSPQVLIPTPSFTETGNVKPVSLR